jgi:hypothetical protein
VLGLGAGVGQEVEQELAGPEPDQYPGREVREEEADDESPERLDRILAGSEVETRDESRRVGGVDEADADDECEQVRDRASLTRPPVALFLGGGSPSPGAFILRLH